MERRSEEVAAYSLFAGTDVVDAIVVTAWYTYLAGHEASLVTSTTAVAVAVAGMTGSHVPSMVAVVQHRMYGWHR